MSENGKDTSLARQVVIAVITAIVTLLSTQLYNVVVALFSGDSLSVQIWPSISPTQLPVTFGENKDFTISYRVIVKNETNESVRDIRIKLKDEASFARILGDNPKYNKYWEYQPISEINNEIIIPELRPAESDHIIIWRNKYFLDTYSSDTDLKYVFDERDAIKVSLPKGKADIIFHGYVPSWLYNFYQDWPFYLLMALMVGAAASLVLAGLVGLIRAIWARTL